MCCGHWLDLHVPPHLVCRLGWVAGPICIMIFFAISLWSSHLLAQLCEALPTASCKCRLPQLPPAAALALAAASQSSASALLPPLHTCADRIGNVEFARYHHLVAHVCGRGGSIAVAVFQLLNLVLTCIAYSITGAIAMKTIANYLGTKPNSVREREGCSWQLAPQRRLQAVDSPAPSLPPSPSLLPGVGVCAGHGRPGAGVLPGTPAVTAASLPGELFWEVSGDGTGQGQRRRRGEGGRRGGPAAALPPAAARCLPWHPQIPSLEEIWWVSALGTLSSLGYVAITLILGLVYCECWSHRGAADAVVAAL